MITIRDVNTHKRTLPDLRLENAKGTKTERANTQEIPNPKKHESTERKRKPRIDSPGR